MLGTAGGMYVFIDLFYASNKITVNSLNFGIPSNFSFYFLHIFSEMSLKEYTKYMSIFFHFVQVSLSRSNQSRKSHSFFRIEWRCVLRFPTQ